MLNASANTRKVITVLWLVRNGEGNYLSPETIRRRTGVDARDVRRVLLMLERRGMVVRTSYQRFAIAAKGHAYAERINRAFAAADQARRTAELGR